MVTVSAGVVGILDVGPGVGVVILQQAGVGRP